MTASMSTEFITIKGAREHNLKGIDVRVPKNKLVVVTGLSGSGKSSLAFDTIYAEGQRRYVESLSAYARQFLEQMHKPDVDSIEGLSPAISIEQRTISKNPRSTVGTTTEIYDYLRVLFARIGLPHCYNCGKPIVAQTVSQMVDQIMALPGGTKIIIIAPVIKDRKGEHKTELMRLLKAGFVRVIVDGTQYDLGTDIELDKNKKHNIKLIVDRLVVKKGIEKRLADSIETGLKHGEGILEIDANGKTSLFSEKSACIDCGISYPEITPQLFSFNSPRGACEECTGLGTKMYFDPDLIVPNKHLSIREGALLPWHSSSSSYYVQIYQSLAEHYHFDYYTPFNDLPENIQKMLLYGSGDEKIRFKIDLHGRKESYTNTFSGIIPFLEKKYRTSESDWVREDIEKYMNIRPCPKCRGSRLRPESLHIKVGGKSISDVTALPILKCVDFFDGLKLTPKAKVIANRILKEIKERLGFLINVGLGYLTLDRASMTLAGGESQRIRLATQIGSALTGVLYVLDEPSIGLHPRDTKRLVSTLLRLRDLGNTVLVTEHDRDTILSADYIIDLGPGAGTHGGKITAEGTPKEILNNPNSLTGRFLSGKEHIEAPKSRRKSGSEKIIICGATEHNLKKINIEIPLGLFVCVTGVSGSGKSTLINETLYPALMQRLYHSKIPAGKVDSIEGLQYLDKVINIDQSPIGRTPRSNPATYTGVFTHIRDLFALLPESKARGFKAGRYSFNVKGGRCEACEGDGIIRIEMHFMPDVYVECEVCRGKRFNRETLEIAYKGKNVSDILDMTVNQSYNFFENIPAIKGKLKTLIDVGLGYLELGQSATTLSGGEAQRIKLSKELSKRSTGRTLYILDEPTTGLHFADVQKLLFVLNKLVDAGNTVVVVEHNLDVIKCADYIIDLGPEGGDDGGRLVASGTPEDLVKIKNSFTASYLKPLLTA